MKLQDVAAPGQETTNSVTNSNSNGNGSSQPSEKPSDQTQPSSQKPQPEDLLSRVTKFVEAENPAGKSEEQIDAEIYNDEKFREKINSLADPELKDYLTKLRKSGVSGVQSKLHEISDIRKELQSLKQGIQSSNQAWTPDRVQKLLNDPEFLTVAQKMTNVESPDDEYVPESVKRRLDRLDQLEKEMTGWKQAQLKQTFEYQHNELSNRYGNYDRNRIDEIRADLLEGKVQATNEHLYKAFYHDANVKKAYELGRKDAMEGVGEKESLSSFTSGSRQSEVQVIKPQENESNKTLWNRIMTKNLAALKK